MKSMWDYPKTKREKIEQLRNGYKYAIVMALRRGEDDPKIWDLIGISEDEYYQNGSEYELEIVAADRAQYNVGQLKLSAPWKAYGVERWDRICKSGEGREPRVTLPKPSRKEREYPGGCGSPIAWCE